MASPVSIGEVIEIGKVIYRIIDDYKKAPGEVRAIAAEVGDVQKSLDFLAKEVKKPNSLIKQKNHPMSVPSFNVYLWIYLSICVEYHHVRQHTCLYIACLLQTWYSCKVS